MDDVEIDLEDALHLFVGKTIVKMDASCCNEVQFLFSDGSRVAMHIDCTSLGLPTIAACTHCATIEA